MNPRAKPAPTAVLNDQIERVRREQGLCVDYILGGGPDQRGAWHGLADWLMEDILIAEEQKRKYAEFLKAKHIRFQPAGFNPGNLNPKLFDWQTAITRLALQKGRYALFEDCGMGKGVQQLEWGHQVSQHMSAPVILFCPLPVTEQARDEAAKFDIEARIVESQSDIGPGVNITNYEKLHKFSPVGICGIVLDESSILKSLDGATRTALTDFSRDIPYRLCCTATPAPNDYMELGNHAEFLGIMRVPEMLATFFVHDGGDTSKWRLKKHAVDAFWKWMCSWSMFIRKPSDIGYSDEGFILPELRMHQITVPTDLIEEGLLFPVEAKTLQERRGARKASINKRVEECAFLVNHSPDQWIVWCNLNAESEALTKAIDGAVEVTGTDKDEHKKKSARDFAAGKLQRLVSKSLIFGHGMNWQSCHKMAICGLSDSWEQFYQLVRRSWRFGQKHPVDCYVIVSETEGAVVRNIQRKEEQARKMAEGMLEHMKDEMKRELQAATEVDAVPERQEQSGEGWRVILNDSIPEMMDMADASVGYSIFSPPFASLYTYSHSDRDMGNCRSHAEFYEHIGFLIPQLYRTLIPGRLVSFHCMNLPMSKERDGEIGQWDFRGNLIRMFQTCQTCGKNIQNHHDPATQKDTCGKYVGFIFHSEVCIWKDPVTAMQRTKALGLLHKQIVKDSCMSRQGIPDYLVTMRKPGKNPEPVSGRFEDYVGEKGTGPTPDVIGDRYSIEVWQRYASPVWMDINPSDTLQKESAREQEDERHICALQLQVIERAIDMWSNPDDLVLSPFAGIGSEGYVALQNGRRFLGVELKESYWEQACANLRAAQAKQTTLFAAEAR